MRNTQEFEAHERSLQDLLKQCHHPTRIAWTFFEDYVWHDCTLYLDGNFDLIQNRLLTIETFNDTAANMFGIEFKAIATSDGLSLCSAFTPQTSREAELLMISDVKLCILEPLISCQVVTDAVEWTKMVARAKRNAPQPSPVDGLMHSVGRTARK